MSIKLTKRIAADILGRGENSIRISAGSLEEAKKAITREDVRSLIKTGSVYALKERGLLSIRGKILEKKKKQGRRRGPGTKKGTRKARSGNPYKKRIGGQRRVLKKLKEEKLIDNEMFKRFYALVKGGNFTGKATLINHIKESGIQIGDEKFAELKKL